MHAAGCVRTRLIDDELTSVLTLLEEHRVVTLVGLPGVGKRALADEVHERCGVAIVGPGDAPKPDGPALRLLDAPTGEADEVPFWVRPLPLPPRAAAADTVLACPSVQLFVRAAIRAGAELGPLEGHVSALAKIAERASGLPLALEIAASLAPVLSLEDVARALERPAHVAGATKGTLAAAYAPIFAALAADEVALLVRLSPHRVGLAIGIEDALGPARGLARRALIERVELPWETSSCFRVPELVAALALELCPRDLTEAARRAHALAIEERLHTESRAAWSGARPMGGSFVLEHDGDVELLVSHARERAEPDLRRAAASAALELGRAGAMEPQLARIESAFAAHGDPEIEARVAIERAGLLLRSGRGERAAASIARARAALADWTPSPGRPGQELETELLLVEGLFLREVRRDYGAARAALEGAARTADPLLRAKALLLAGGTATWAERHGAAIAAFEWARAALEGIGAPRIDAILATNLAIAWIGHWPMRCGEPRTLLLERARSAAAAFERLRDTRSAGVAHQAAALTLTTLLRFREARVELEAMRTRVVEVGDRRYELVATVNLGDTALALGELVDAREHYASARALSAELGDRLLSAVTMASQADLAWERGERALALDALGASRGILEQTHEHAARLALVLAAEAALGPPQDAEERFERAARLVEDPDDAHHHAVRVAAARSSSTWSDGGCSHPMAAGAISPSESGRSRCSWRSPRQRSAARASRPRPSSKPAGRVSACSQRQERTASTQPHRCCASRRASAIASRATARATGSPPVSR